MSDEVGFLKEVPGVIKESGRVAGFEHMRDRLLSDWETFIAKGVNAYSALKLVIEMDRHALFAQVQADKNASKDKDQWKEFQQYLEGKVEVAPSSGTAELPEDGEGE